MEQQPESRYRWGVKRHMRRPGTYKGMCGIGYDWPSSVALTDDLDEVSCGTCVFEMNKESEDADRH